MKAKNLTYLCTVALAVACRGAGAPAPPSRTAAPAGTRAALGLTTVVPPQAIADAMGLELQIRQEGRLVLSVVEGGAAAEAGIRAGDALVQLAEVRLYSQDDIDDLVSIHRPGDVLPAVLIRGDTLEREELTVELGSAPALPGPRIAWQFASLAQLPAALERARAEKKKVLVGVSGAET